MGRPRNIVELTQMTECAEARMAQLESECSDLRTRLAAAESARDAANERLAGVVAALTTELGCVKEELTGDGVCHSMSHQQRHKAMVQALAASAMETTNETS